MEEFTILSDGSYNSNNNAHHHHNHHHHHKDHMLAAGSSQTQNFVYDITNKPEISVLKSDYSMFTNYIQQSALLERAVDPALDSSCLSGLCDMKFSSSPTSNASLNNDTQYKNLSIINIEANNTLTKSANCTMVPSGTESTSSDLNLQTPTVSSFSNIIFPRENQLESNKPPVQHRQQQQNCTLTQPNYLNLKLNNRTVDDENLPHDHYLPNSAAAVSTSSCDTADIIGYTISNSHNNNVRSNSDKSLVKSNTNNNNNNSNTILATSFLNVDTENHRNNLNGSNQNTTCDSIGNGNLSNTNNNNNINSIAHNNNNDSHNLLNLRNSVENQISTTTTTPTTTAVTNSTTKSILQHNEDVASSSCASLLIAAPNPSNANNEVPPPLDSLNHSLSISDCDSLSSDELIDLENNERGGYQDNTSSHSQQSAGGGGGGGLGGGGPGSGVVANASNSNILLLNGVGQPTQGSGGAGGYMSLIPPSVGAASSSGHLVGGTSGGGTSASAGGAVEGIDFKHLFEELCPVCGDKVSGYHYGLLTCESCKGFFKRTVQNKKVYTCVAERSCHIDKTQRKRCPYCRFQKCLEVGMKLEAVRADRMRGGRNKFGPMYKRDRARKLQVMRQRQLALQALRTSIGSADMKSTPLTPGYQQAYPNMNIKQEIQIPQVSSLTQSPDASPSPIAIALGQVNTSTGVISNTLSGNTGTNSNNTSTTSDSINRSGASSCHDTGTGTLQNTADSKLCFDSSTHPSSTADSVIEPLRVSPMIRDFVQSIDDREWQTQLFALLQKQTYNQVEVDLFELMCKVLDQNLFSQVDWARNTVFFKDLKVDDQMKLLQHSWSDMLVLDHLHQRIHNGLPDETQLNNGQVFNLLGLGLLGVPQLSDYFNELQNKLQDLKFDMGDYVCMKFLILLNPDVRGIINKKTVLEGHENVQAALLDYTLTCYPSVTDKFRRLLNILPDIHAMASRGEEHLYSKHCAGSAPTQTLLMEMLHAKRKV